jgi:hypothetical protein
MPGMEAGDNRLSSGVESGETRALRHRRGSPPARIRLRSPRASSSDSDPCATTFVEQVSAQAAADDSAVLRQFMKKILICTILLDTSSERFDCATRSCPKNAGYTSYFSLRSNILARSLIDHKTAA